MAKYNIKKASLLCALFFIVVNPSDNNGEEGFSFYPTSVTLNNSEEKAKKVIDYYKLGKLYLLQGELAPSYKAFVLGNAIDGVRGLADENLVKKISGDGFSDEPNASNLVKKDSVNKYLERLINLYLERIDYLIKKGKYERALSEIKKVYIVDPKNEKAKEYEKKAKSGLRDVVVSPATSVKGGNAGKKEGKKLPYSEIEKALEEAEKAVSRSILSSSGDDDALLVKKNFDSGKELLKKREYIFAIKRFKKVIALDEEGIYAAYARRYINVAMNLLKKEEEAALREIERMAFSSTSDSGVKTVSDRTENICSPETDGSVGGKFPGSNENMDVELNKVLSRVMKLIDNEEYKEADDVLKSLEVIDPGNEKIVSVRNILTELRDKAVEKEKNRIEKFREREELVRKALNEKYVLFKRINREAMEKASAEKKEKLEGLMEYFFSEKNYFAAYEVAEKVEMLDTANEKALYIKKETLRKIKEYSGKYCEDNISAKKKDSLDKKALKGLLGGIAAYEIPENMADKSKIKVLAPFSGDMKLSLPEIEVRSRKIDESKNGTGKKVKPVEKKKTVVVSKKNFKEKGGRFVKKDENTVALVKVVEKKTCEEACKYTDKLPEKENTAESIASDRFAEKMRNIDKWLKKWADSDGATVKRSAQIREYMKRGKKFLEERNYPLAMINFKRVKSMDVEGYYSGEVDNLITETERYLK